MAGKGELKGGPAAKKRKTSAKAVDDVPLVLDKGACACLHLCVHTMISIRS